MRALQLFSLLAGALDLSPRRQPIERRHVEPMLYSPPLRRRRHRDRLLVKRVACPGGFRWHVKENGETKSSHLTEAEARGALKALRGR